MEKFSDVSSYRCKRRGLPSKAVKTISRSKAKKTIFKGSPRNKTSNFNAKDCVISKVNTLSCPKCGKSFQPLPFIQHYKQCETNPNVMSLKKAIPKESSPKKTKYNEMSEIPNSESSIGINTVSAILPEKTSSIVEACAKASIATSNDVASKVVLYYLIPPCNTLSNTPYTTNNIPPFRPILPHSTPVNITSLNVTTPTEMSVDKVSTNTEDVVHSFNCTDCAAKYDNKKNLLRHYRIKHQFKKKSDNTLYKRKDNKIRNFVCTDCGNKYTTKKSLVRHCEDKHGLERIVFDKKNVFCSLCAKNVSRKDFFLHCEDDHDIAIETEEFQFSSFDEFKIWKENIEKATKAKYTRRTKEKVIRGGVIKLFFRCHRSGVFNSSGKEIQYKKKLGTGDRRMNGYCPARMEVFKQDNECRVLFTRTHVGHEKDLIYIHLTPKERELIASKLALKMPCTEILDEIRDSVGDNPTDRMYLVTPEDIQNIEEALNNNSETVYQFNQEETIDSWVNVMHSIEDSCILFYKPQGIDSIDYPDLLSHDFVLIIMNGIQCEILNMYGAYCVCIDRINRLDEHGLVLTSLMVLDQIKGGFPCAFLISNRYDEYILSLFFECIKHKCGIITTQVFMSGMEEVIYRTWVSVMMPTKEQVYCSWDVDTEWRENLTMITCQQKQIETYNILRKLLKEKNSNIFKKNLDHIVDILLDDAETAEFGNYFKEVFFTNTAVWAHRYSLKVSSDIYKNFKHIHKVLEHTFLQGSSENLHIAMQVIMQLIRDKLLHRLKKLFYSELSSKLQTVKQRHKLSTHIRGPLVKVEDGWHVRATPSSKSVYLVTENVVDCKCKTVCSICKVCVHRYICTCIDSRINWNMCVHVHYVCFCLLGIKVKSDILNEKNSITDIEMDSETHVNEVLYESEDVNRVTYDSEDINEATYESEDLNEVLHESEDVNDAIYESEDDNKIVDKTKEFNDISLNVEEDQVSFLVGQKKKELLTYFLDEVNNIQTLEEINFVENLLAPLKPTLDVIRARLNKLA